jgi:hypothetical protein
VSETKLFHKWKVHLFFGGGLWLVFAISITINLLSGHTLFSATIDALRQIRPMEYVMFFLFWYWFARGQQTNSRPTLTSLNLGGSKT